MGWLFAKIGPAAGKRVEDIGNADLSNAGMGDGTFGAGHYVKCCHDEISS